MSVLSEKLLLLKGRSDEWIWQEWMNEGFEIPFFVTIIYVLFVYFGRIVMEKREAFHLQMPLAIWNFLLAGIYFVIYFAFVIYLLAFSIYGVFMTFPIFFGEWIKGRGFVWELCNADVEVSNPWTMYFCLSKIPELLDTVFIILRKKPLKFLQYYHHIVTMWFCWIAWARKLESGGMPST